MHKKEASALFAAVCICLAGACSPTERATSTTTPARPYVAAASVLEAGRHITIVGGCNDCHTAGYAQSGGQVPESEWLKGDAVGNYGPWGTSYPSNLRLTTAAMSEDDWVTMLQTRDGLPIMPWSIMRAYDERDLRALYQFIRQLPGEAGEPAPTALPPGAPPQGPYVDHLTHGGPPPG